jgi:HPt (histidine-containing phosphotransfer) domain-containing protein
MVDNESAPINFSRLQDLSDGDEEQSRKIMNLYLQVTGEALGKIEKALQERNYEEVERFSHSSAGSSGMLGITSLVSLFRELENMGHTRDLTRSTPLIKDIRKELVRVEEFWKTYLKTTNS